MRCCIVRCIVTFTDRLYRKSLQIRQNCCITPYTANAPCTTGLSLYSMTEHDRRQSHYTVYSVYTIQSYTPTLWHGTDAESARRQHVGIVTATREPPPSHRGRTRGPQDPAPDRPWSNRPIRSAHRAASAIRTPQADATPRDAARRHDRMTFEAQICHSAT